jgi:hypothetical protein
MDWNFADERGPDRPPDLWTPHNRLVHPVGGAASVRLEAWTLDAPAAIEPEWTFLGESEKLHAEYYVGGGIVLRDDPPTNRGFTVSSIWWHFAGLEGGAPLQLSVPNGFCGIIAQLEAQTDVQYAEDPDDFTLLAEYKMDCAYWVGCGLVQGAWERPDEDPENPIKLLIRLRWTAWMLSGQGEGDTGLFTPPPLRLLCIDQAPRER